jgi:hypothetical protein
MSDPEETIGSTGVGNSGSKEALAEDQLDSDKEVSGSDEELAAKARRGRIRERNKNKEKRASSRGAARSSREDPEFTKNDLEEQEGSLERVQVNSLKSQGFQESRRDAKGDELDSSKRPTRSSSQKRSNSAKGAKSRKSSIVMDFLGAEDEEDVRGDTSSTVQEEHEQAESLERTKVIRLRSQRLQEGHRNQSEKNNELHVGLDLAKLGINSDESENSEENDEVEERVQVNSSEFQECWLGKRLSNQKKSNSGKNAKSKQTGQGTSLIGAEEGSGELVPSKSSTRSSSQKRSNSAKGVKSNKYGQGTEFIGFDRESVEVVPSKSPTRSSSQKRSNSAKGVTSKNRCWSRSRY